jgi:hypothetical protein
MVETLCKQAGAFRAEGGGMTRGMIAGTVYFLIVFALGFALGTMRVLYLVPWLHELVATLIEVPVMLTVSFLVCRWVLIRFQVLRFPAARWAMVPSFLSLLLLCEWQLGLWLFERSAAAQWAALATPAGAFGLFAQILVAFLPAFVGKAGS